MATTAGMQGVIGQAALPSVFVSHGTPMVALQDDAFTQALAGFFEAIPRPVGIVVISAHWQSAGPLQITAAPRQRAIHDYRGFPEELHAVTWTPPGSPELALQVSSLLAAENFQSTLNPSRGLDHGAWVPLRIGFPGAEVPVVQLSLPLPGGAAEALRMGKALRELRREGVLLVGSGGAVHNLQKIRWHGKDGPPAPFAEAFKGWLLPRLEQGKISELLRFEEAPGASEAQPSPEHLLPMFVTLGASLPEDRFRLIFDGYSYWSLSMLSFCLG